MRWVSFVVIMFWTAAAVAEVPGPRVAVVPPLAELDAGPAEEEPPFVPRLDRDSRWGVSLQGYSGIVTYWAGGATTGHALVGGTVRGRYGYVSIGGFYESSDRIEPGQWKSSGGFGGLHVPFANWVDLDALLGFGIRTHENDDLRYGSHGYSVSTPTLCLRLGVSDRSGRSLGAFRIGAELLASVDLRREPQSWRLEYSRGEGVPPTVFTGETDVGGTSVGIALTIGLDVAEPRAKPR
jgi:hypothetical protein